MRDDDFGVVDISSDERRGIAAPTDVVVATLSVIGAILLSVVAVLFH